MCLRVCVCMFFLLFGPFASSRIGFRVSDSSKRDAESRTATSASLYVQKHNRTPESSEEKRCSGLGANRSPSGPASEDYWASLIVQEYPLPLTIVFLKPCSG